MYLPTGTPHAARTEEGASLHLTIGINRATDVVEKQFLRVDVTEEFPFLVTRLSPYYDR